MTTSISSLSAHEREVLGRVPTGLLIGGEWRPATGGKTLAVEDPAPAHDTGEPDVDHAPWRLQVQADAEPEQEDGGGRQPGSALAQSGREQQANREPAEQVQPEAAPIVQDRMHSTLFLHSKFQIPSS